MNQPAFRGDKLFPLIVTKAFDATRSFYVDQLGATLTFDLPSYIQVRFGEAAESAELCFMRFGGPQPGPPVAFTGGGVVISVRVPSADDYAETLKAKGIELLGPPEDQPWQWRSVLVEDPSGVILDFFHPLGTEPKRCVVLTACFASSSC